MQRLSLNDYPNLDLADSGKLPNIGYGVVEGVACQCIAGGATALLDADISATDTLINVDDVSRFPAAPFTIQTASEKMRVTAVSGNTFTVQRGYEGTTATAHGKGRTVFEARASYCYLLSPEPVKSIAQVYVDGIRQATGLPGTGYTAYTGKSGDEHPGWPGHAVIEFSVEPSIVRQRNTEGAPTASTEAMITAVSHTEIAEGASGVPLSVKGNQSVWVAFAGTGAITGTSKTYTASVSNTSAADGLLMAVIKDTGSSALIKAERVFIPASSTKTIEIEEVGTVGGFQRQFILMPSVGSFEVYYLKMSATMVKPPEEEDYETCEPSVSVCSFKGAGIEKTVTLRPLAKPLAWVSYPAQSLGVIERQTHYALVENTGGAKAKARLVAAEANGGAISIKEFYIASGASATVALTHQGGGWDSMTKLIIISGELRVERLYKEVRYLPDGVKAEKPFSSSSARLVIGDEITADAQWTFDSDGNYGGLDTLVERPDYLIKHFIVKRMGFALADMDDESFSASGAFYNTAIAGGYKFAFIISDEIDRGGPCPPSELLDRLAFECRSTVRYRNGKWYLSAVPDASPSPVKTIRREELAGANAVFKFRKTPMDGLVNDLTARIKRKYNHGPKESRWQGIVKKTDDASKAKYGIYKKELELKAVRSSAMAEHVLSHLLLRGKTPRLLVEFPVWWEHFDLNVGDTIQIENPLYNGKKFRIEGIKRLDKFMAEIKATEWWG